MAVTLPSPESLGLVLPQADRAPVSYTGGIAQTAQESIGRAVSGVGDAVTKVANDYADAQDKVNYAASYSNFLQQKLQLDQKYETDTDYATAPQRYSDDLQKAASDASAGIRSAPMQAQFMDTTARMREYAMNSQVSRAHAKSVDADRAYLTDQLQTTVDAAGQATDPTTRVGLYDAYGGLVQGMVAKGSITKSEGIKLAEAASNQGAVRYFKTLSDTDPTLAARLLMPGAPALAPGLHTDLGAAIHGAAATHGADEAVLARTAQIEDGNGKLGNGGGAFQFIPSTAAAYGLRNPDDAATSADAAARLQVDNKRALNVSLGRDPSGPELYLAHQQGASGAAALIGNPDQRAVDALTPAYGGDRAQATRAITGNGGSTSMTAGAFTAMWADKYNGTAGHVPGPTAPPTQDAAGAPLYPKTGDLRDFLRPDQRADLMHMAEARAQALARAAEVDGGRQQRLQEKALKDASDQAENKVISDVTGSGDNPHITAQQIADPKGPYNQLLPDAKLRMIGFMDRQQKPDPAGTVSHQIAMGLISDIRAGRVTDTGPIFDAYTRKDADGNPAGLTNNDFNFVQGQFKELQTDSGQRLDQTVNKFLQAVKPSIDKSNPLSGQLDMSGGGNFFRLQQDLASKIADYRKAGKDPFDLLNPSKPDYVGSPDALSGYQTSTTEALTAYSDRMRKQSAAAAAKTPPAKGAAVTKPAPPFSDPSGEFGPPTGARPSLDQIFGH